MHDVCKACSFRQELVWGSHAELSIPCRADHVCLETRSAQASFMPEDGNSEAMLRRVLLYSATSPVAM